MNIKILSMFEGYLVVDGNDDTLTDKVMIDGTEIELQGSVSLSASEIEYDFDFVNVKL